MPEQPETVEQAEAEVEHADADLKAAEATDSVILRLTAPWTLSAYVSGSRLTVNKRGVRLNRADAEAAVDEAAKHGVTLTIGT